MSLISKLSPLLNESKLAYESARPGSFIVSESIGECKNILANSDNLPFMKFLLDKHNMKGKINLVYIDPPFFSKANYGTEIKLYSDKIKKIPVIKQNAYYDVWEEGMEEYLKMIAIRLFGIKDLLAEDGCLWVHLDWHSVHYVKIILDEVFGEKNFINEIIWNYKSGGVSKNYFARKHDTLLFYAKSQKYYFKAQQEKSYNRDYKPYRFKGVSEFKDELGWYTMVSMKDVWQINMVGRTSAERTGYATQKPEQLIQRILESCTKEGDICADFFGGSGTLAASAEKMNRRWISCDLGKLATVNTHKRMVNHSLGGYVLYEELNNIGNGGIIEVETCLQSLVVSDKIKLKVTLKSYKPSSVKEISVEEKYIEVIKKIIKNDSLQLIDYWSIDFNYNGKEFKPEQYFCKGNNGMKLSCEKSAEEFKKIGIKVLDIFGNSAFALINLEGAIVNENKN